MRAAGVDRCGIMCVHQSYGSVPPSWKSSMLCACPPHTHTCRRPRVSSVSTLDSPGGAPGGTTQTHPFGLAQFRLGCTKGPPCSSWPRRPLLSRPPRLAVRAPAPLSPGTSATDNTPMPRGDSWSGDRLDEHLEWPFQAPPEPPRLPQKALDAALRTQVSHRHFNS